MKSGLRLLLATALVSASFAAVGTQSVLAGPPVGFTTSVMLDGLSVGPGGLPVAYAYAPDGRIFVARKTGVIDVYDNGVKHIYWDLRDEVNTIQSRGLLGLAIDPDFSTNHRVFAMFTQELNPENPDQDGPQGGAIVRVSQQAGNPNAADMATRVTLLTGYQSVFREHTVGALRFDAAGKLLASFGDAANLGVNGGIAMEALNLDDLRGKIIRIDPVTGFGIPGNPYFNPGDPGAVRSKVYARGFRNPYRFTVDPENGALYVGDVGWNTWETLKTFPATYTVADRDRNGGWPCYEGGDGVALPQPDYQFAPATQAACQEIYTPEQGGTGVGAAAPLYGYRHDAPGGEYGSAITAGPKYVGTSNYPAEYEGKVFIGDYARDRFQTVDPVTGDAADFGAAGDWGYPVDIKIAPDGNISYLAIGASEIREIVYTGSNHVPVAVATATQTSSPTAPFAAQFQGSGSSDIDAGDTLTYDWDFGDGTPHSSETDPVHEYAAAGSYHATLTVSDGHPGGTVASSLWIDVANTPPTVALTSPSPLLRYRIGDTIALELDAQDEEDGALSGTSVFSQVRLIHLGHFHPEIDFSGTTTAFDVEDHGSDNTYYEVISTATDGFGRSTTSTTTILPDKQPVSITSTPPGAVVSVDGVQVTTPHDFASIIGSHHEIDAAADLVVGADRHTFDRWTQNSVSANSQFFTFDTPPEGTALNADYSPTAKGLSVSNGSIVEGDSGARTAMVNVSLSGPSASTVTVEYTTLDGSGAGGAIAPSDYESKAGTLTFAPGVINQKIAVSVNGDTDDEGDEQFRVVLSNPSGAPAVLGTGTVTVIDDDPGSGLRFSVGNLTVLEGDEGLGVAEVTVTLSAPSPGGLSVQYAMPAGSASTPSDYAAKSGNLNFKKHKTSATIKVKISGDGTFEPSETFGVVLSNPVGATIERGVGTVRLANDDPGPSLSIADLSSVEGATGARYVFVSVVLSTPSTKQITVDYVVAHQTTNDGDVKTKPGTLTLRPGKLAATFQVKTLGDANVEPAETYTVTLSNPVNAVIAKGTATGTVIDDDPSSGIRASVGDAAITEGDSGQRQLAFTVTLSDPAPAPINVVYATGAQSATAGADYTTKNGTAKFLVGKSSLQVTVVLKGDATPEANETFTFTLSSPTGGAILGRSVAIGGILNDD